DVETFFRELYNSKGEFCFFFSSRRRHTRLQGDWSSDVCSSDLQLQSRRRRRTAADVSLFLLPDKGIAGIAKVGARRYGLDLQTRSEERRVGKESRYWWLTYH